MRNRLEKFEFGKLLGTQEALNTLIRALPRKDYYG